MGWIKTISNEEATGSLAKRFDEAMKRAGRVFHIVRIMSLNPATLESSMSLYRTIMFGPSPLSRSRREMLAVVVSLANTCHY